MKKSIGVQLLFGFIGLLALTGGVSAGQIDNKEKALLALRSGDNATAIRICQSELKLCPGDYDLRFTLAQAYAHSEKYDEALAILNNMAAENASNVDVLIFRAKVLSWKRDYRAAEARYRSVLKIAAANLEAQTGLAELASWQKDYARAISRYEQILARHPDNADVLFRLGRVHLWAGNYRQARACFKQAVELEPQNSEYQHALQTASARLRGRSELRYEYQSESFSDSRGRYLDQNVAFQLSLPKNFGPLILKYNETRRHDRGDERWGIEIYPRLWNKAYGYFDLALSSKAVHFPRAAYLLEVYQGLLTSAEISLGFRQMNFPEGVVSQYLGTVGYYFGNYYAYWRWYYSRTNAHGQFSWAANIRRYFSKDDYVFAGFGWGTKPYELTTIEDFRLHQTWLVMGGFDWTFFGKLRLKLYYSWSDEGPIHRQTLYLSPGYRF
jgi:YaiO family outer membrane protein